MELVLDVIAWAALLTGSFFLVVGGYGLLRMPDFFTRGHAAGITDTLGAGLVLGGLMIEAGWSLNLARLSLILIFLLFTSPTASHALAHAALTAGMKPWTRASARDDAAPPKRVAESPSGDGGPGEAAETDDAILPPPRQGAGRAGEARKGA
jgi:multicomponent Na+:H+ antiporter subunit G